MTWRATSPRPCWKGYLENAVGDGPAVLNLRCPQARPRALHVFVFPFFLSASLKLVLSAVRLVQPVSRLGAKASVYSSLFTWKTGAERCLDIPCTHLQVIATHTWKKLMLSRHGSQSRTLAAGQVHGARDGGAGAAVPGPRGRRVIENNLDRRWVDGKPKLRRE